MIDPIIDNELNLHGHDYLEVSSPGLERPLKTDRDFARYQGEWVELTLYKAMDGQKKYQGSLAPCTAGQLIGIEPGGSGTCRQFPREQVAKSQTDDQILKMRLARAGTEGETQSMNAELIEALRLLEKERGIDAEVLFEAIEEALVSAYKREFEAKTTDNIRAEVDRQTGEMRVFLTKTVVETGRGSQCRDFARGSQGSVRGF